MNTITNIFCTSLLVNTICISIECICRSEIVGTKGAILVDDAKKFFKIYIL